MTRGYPFSKSVHLRSCDCRLGTWKIDKKDKGHLALNLLIHFSILGVPNDCVHIADMSTDTAPNATESGGSFGTDFNGAAVMDACKKLRRILEPFVQENPGGSWTDWINAAYAKRTNLQVTGFFKTSAVNADFDTNTGITTDYW